MRVAHGLFGHSSPAHAGGTAAGQHQQVGPDGLRALHDHSVGLASFDLDAELAIVPARDRRGAGGEGNGRSACELGQVAVDALEELREEGVRPRCRPEHVQQR